MDLQKFTERARGFLEAAQTMATREDHQRLAPEHLLKALMDDEEGLASNLIRATGGAPERVVEAVDQALAGNPQVSGDAGQVYMDRPSRCWTRRRRSPGRLATATCRWNVS